MNYELASFLIPWGVILHTSIDGLKATFMASYSHMMISFAVFITVTTVVCVKVCLSNQSCDLLDQTVLYTKDRCKNMCSTDGQGTDSFYQDVDVINLMTCGAVSGNTQDSYLTMMFSNVLVFGIINIVKCAVLTGLDIFCPLYGQVSMIDYLFGSVFHLYSKYKLS